MKKNIILLAVFALSMTAYSQLKVMPSGYVGIGTNTPLANLHVNGRINITGNNNLLRILPDNPGVEIVSSTDIISFWYSSTGHNNLYAQQYYTQSDISTKTNILPLTNGLNTIKQLNPCSYNSKADSINFEQKLSYGLIAQEVYSVLPELVDSSKGILLINYDEFIPFIISAIHEQQDQIETLQKIIYDQEKEILNLNSIILSCCEAFSPKNTNVKESPALNAVLYQNEPNPFSESTIIKFIIPEQFTSARIIIHNLNGVEIKSFMITESGEGNITINDAILNSGMYLYTLIVDNAIIETKRMILTN